MKETITLGGGCFWCVDAVLADLKGVSQVLSGYAGGTVENPTYEQVCSGQTGHAEVVEVEFDPEVISLHDLLTIFFTLHDPSTLNRQGNDTGTQYRSVIFYRTEEQKEMAQQVMQEIADAGVWEDPIVTSLEPAGEFYEAEAYHQGYYARQPEQGYCRVIIAPKVAKLRQQFKDKLKA
jgi:peptide-methionine (S)-S-oxide reductase